MPSPSMVNAWPLTQPSISHVIFMVSAKTWILEEKDFLERHLTHLFYQLQFTYMFWMRHLKICFAKSSNEHCYRLRGVSCSWIQLIVNLLGLPNLLHKPNRQWSIECLIRQTMCTQIDTLSDRLCNLWSLAVRPFWPWECFCWECQRCRWPVLTMN